MHSLAPILRCMETAPPSEIQGMSIITPLRARAHKAEATLPKLSDYPAYTVEDSKYREIKGRRRALEAQIEAVKRGIYEAVGGDTEELERRARDILAGG